MKMKKQTALLLVLVLLTVMMGGCSKGEAPKEANVSQEAAGTEADKDTKEGGYTFGATYWTMNNPYFIALEAGIREAVEANGDKLLSYDPQGDVTTQISQVEDLIAQGVDLIFLNPADWEGIRPALDAAEKANVPVIVVDTPVYDSDMVLSTVWSDNYHAGELCAEDLFSKMDSGNIIILDLPTDKSAKDRYQGFYDKIEENGNFTILDTHNGEGSTEGSMPIMDDMIQAYGDEIDVVFGINDPSAIGVIAALEAAGMTEDILVYAVDGSPDGKAMIQDGKLAGTAAQFPEEMGATAVEYAYKALNGETIPEEVFIDVEMVNAETLDNYTIDGWK